MGKQKLKRILFLQLPRLDNDSEGAGENLPMAGFYLEHQMEQTGDRSAYEVRYLNSDEDDLDDVHLQALILDWQPNIIAATLYLWNIERTLHLLKHVRRKLNTAKFIVGGPEMAFSHPFLFKSRIPDMAVVGEGETVFPYLLKALSTGSHPDFLQVACKKGNAYMWGTKPAPPCDLGSCLPKPKHPGWRPDSYGMAYLETGRGCPMGCSYCRYGHLRRRTTFLGVSEVKERVETLVDRGAREIRFVDPVLNAHPEFSGVLKALRDLNRRGKVKFFGEIQADLLTGDQIALLAGAGFSEVEAGVQSLDPNVLKRIGRTVRLSALENNLHHLSRNGIRVTVDLMYGLPGQKYEDIESSLRWTSGFRRAHVQCFQTLLLPGTRLREDRRRWHLKSQNLPPYGVRATDALTEDDVQGIEEMIHRKHSGHGLTRKFVGRTLPDLFEEQIVLPVQGRSGAENISGVRARRALIFKGKDLFGHRRVVLSALRRAILTEPHMHWQFVLNPEAEEPLDLIEEMISEIKRHPVIWTDRFAAVAAWDRVSSRRVFVLLRRSGRYSRSWIEATEHLLSDHFY